MTQDKMQTLREDLVECFKTQRMAQILDVDERAQLEAAFADRLEGVFSEYNSLRQALGEVRAVSQHALDSYNDPPMSDNVYAAFDHINGIARREVLEDQ